MSDRDLPFDREPKEPSPLWRWHFSALPDGDSGRPDDVSGLERLPGGVLVAKTRNGCFRSSDLGGSWSRVAPAAAPSPPSGSSGAADGRIALVGGVCVAKGADSGLWRRPTSGAEPWVALPARSDAALKAARGLLCADSLHQLWSVEQFQWLPQRLAPSPPPRRVWRSEDLGESWQLMGTMWGHGALRFSPSGTPLTLGFGGVWRLEESGEWCRLGTFGKTDAYANQAHGFFTTADRLVVLTGQNAWASRDGGATFRTISGRFIYREGDTVYRGSARALRLFARGPGDAVFATGGGERDLPNVRGVFRYHPGTERWLPMNRGLSRAALKQPSLAAGRPYPIVHSLLACSGVLLAGVRGGVFRCSTDWLPEAWSREAERDANDGRHGTSLILALPLAVDVTEDMERLRRLSRARGLCVDIERVGASGRTLGVWSPPDRVDPLETLSQLADRCGFHRGEVQLADPGRSLNPESWDSPKTRDDRREVRMLPVAGRSGGPDEIDLDALIEGFDLASWPVTVGPPPDNWHRVPPPPPPPSPSDRPVASARERKRKPWWRFWSN